MLPALRLRSDYQSGSYQWHNSLLVFAYRIILNGTIPFVWVWSSSYFILEYTRQKRPVTLVTELLVPFHYVCNLMRRPPISHGTLA